MPQLDGAMLPSPEAGPPAAEGATFTIQVVIGAPPQPEMLERLRPLGLPGLGPLPVSLPSGPLPSSRTLSCHHCHLSTLLAVALQGGCLGEEEPLDGMDQGGGCDQDSRPALASPRGNWSVRKPSRWMGSCFSNWSSRLAGSRLILVAWAWLGKGLLWHSEVGVVVDSGEGAARRWQLVVEREEPILWQGILPGKRGLTGKGLCGRQQVGVAARPGEQGLVWWVQAVGEVAGRLSPRPS